MDSKEINRIEFYSKEDGAANYNLIKAEKLLNNYNPQQILSINDLLEFYNIKLYFENDLFLLNWTKAIKKGYSDIVEKTWSSLKEELIKINDQTLENIVNKLEYRYKNNFWDLINSLSVYKKITKSTFNNILSTHPHHINYILPNQGIVNQFDKEIRDFLLKFEKTAEILLSKYEEKQTHITTPKYFFPKSLSLKDKEDIINSYLENDNANLNYVRLAENSKDSNELKLSDKTRLKAKKKSSELNNEIMEKGHTWSVRVQVGFCKDQEEPVIINREQEMLEVTYSEKIIDSLKDNISLFNVFKLFFCYTDETNLIRLVSKRSQLDIMDRIFMKSKNAYETSETFIRKEFLSTLQLHIFNHYLIRNNNNIENLINSFTEYLNEIISPNQIIFKIRNSDSIYLEKIRTLLPEFDFLLKQYKTFTEENIIDQELIQISSAPIRFSEIKSQSNCKYIYSNDNLILQLKHMFFSDQSHLYYTETFGTKHHNLYDLINNEKVTLDDFHNYQADAINNLIKDGYLKINLENYIEIDNALLLYIIRELHLNEVLSYWNYPKFVRDELDIMIENDTVSVENTLLTVQEKNYLNYYLNKKEYTNGYDLRNKYLHGTNTFSDEQHKMDYFLLLKIIILTLLKIEDDILINKTVE